MKDKKTGVAEYSTSSIETKTGIEHIRARPAMYLGTTGAPGLLHTVKEIVTNSVDEAMNGFGNKIEVILYAANRIGVRDYGRGIPTQIVNGITGVELCIGTTNSGGKYDNDNYATSGGTYGVGASVVNAVSSNMEVTVRRADGKTYFARYEEGIKVFPLERGILHIDPKGNKTKDTGSEVIYTPDSKIMEITTFDVEAIDDYLHQLSYVTPGLTLQLDNRVGKDPGKLGTITTYHSKNGLVDYIKRITSGLKNELLIKNPISFSGKLNNNDSYSVVFTYCNDYDSRVMLFVNKNLIPDGGTAVTGFRVGLAKAINDVGIEMGVLKPKDKTIVVKDVDDGLVAIISVDMASPQLEGQTKSKLGNTEMTSLMSTTSFTEIHRVLEASPNVLNNILGKILSGRRLREATSRLRAIEISNNKSKGNVFPSKLKQCISKDSSITELFIVEGESAAGNLVNCRNVNTQAYLGMKGKGLNVLKSSKENILQNDGVVDLFASLGTGFGDTFDISKLLYNKIIILSDADPDGQHITTLLLLQIFKLAKPLLTGGFVYLGIPPLYRVVIGKNPAEYYETVEEHKARIDWLLDKGKVQGKDFVSTRFKGLGEMNASDLGSTCINPAKRVLKQVLLDNPIFSEEVIIKLMSSKTSDDRKSFFSSGGNTI